MMIGGQTRPNRTRNTNAARKNAAKRPFRKEKRSAVVRIIGRHHNPADVPQDHARELEVRRAARRLYGSTTLSAVIGTSTKPFLTAARPLWPSSGCRSTSSR